MQAFNPYLPSWEYIPDGEPRVFGDRVYVYGSHDHFNAPIFCVGDYVCWSAPVENLKDWRYEGVIFKKNQDPKNRLGIRLLFAPDVVQGADGKFYLYYAFDFMGMIGVAVAEKPAGPYRFYGHVHYQDGTVWGRKKGDQFPFDPGVLMDDDGSVYLYSGFYTPTPAIASGFHKLKNDGGVVVKLESDMVTIRENPKLLFPKEGEGSFPNHAVLLPDSAAGSAGKDFRLCGRAEYAYGNGGFGYQRGTGRSVPRPEESAGVLCQCREAADRAGDSGGTVSAAGLHSGVCPYCRAGADGSPLGGNVHTPVPETRHERCLRFSHLRRHHASVHADHARGGEAVYVGVGVGVKYSFYSCFRFHRRNPSVKPAACQLP